MYQQYDPRQDHHTKPHYLDPRNCTVICSHPVWTPHQEQLVDNWVVPVGDVVVLPLLKGMNGVRPKGIIIMDLVQRIFIPGLESLWIFAVRTQRLRDNLGGYNQQSKHLR